MEVATWIGAVSTAVYAVAFLFTAFYVVFQLRESKMQRKATVLQNVYQYVMDTHLDRAVLYKNAHLIRKVHTLDDLERFSAARPDVDKSIHAVANCYHFIGFLLYCKALPCPEDFLDEGGHTLLKVDQIISQYVELCRKRTCQPKYKQYYTALVEMARRDAGACVQSASETAS